MNTEKVLVFAGGALALLFIASRLSAKSALSQPKYIVATGQPNSEAAAINGALTGVSLLGSLFGGGDDDEDYETSPSYSYGISGSPSASSPYYDGSSGSNYLGGLAGSL